MLAALLCLAALADRSEDLRPNREPRPNFVVMLCDDIGAHELGLYGHPTHQTPRLDELGRTGIWFETGYATPICHPTRFAIMTGQYGHHNGVFQFPNRPGGPVVANEGVDDISAHVTFASLLRDAGYATAQCGKWQLSGEHPKLIHEAGFDSYRMWAYRHNLPDGATHDGLWENRQSTKTARYWHPSLVQDGEYLDTGIDDYGPDWFADFAIDFIAEHKHEPFLVYYPMALTHSPYWPTPTDDPADDAKGKHSRANWRSNVEYADRIAGRIVAALEENGVRENTVVLFIGDNGTGGDGKAQPTERGCRVPFIVNGPGLVQPTGRSRELVDITDVLPTLCELAGVDLPDDRPIDGISFAPYLRGETEPLRDYVYGYLGEHRIVRTKRHLLERNTMADFGRLYDCGDSRDGTGYRDITDDDTPEADAARKQMRQILADKPAPIVTAGSQDPIPKQLKRNQKAKRQGKLKSQNEAPANRTPAKETRP